MLEKAGIMLKCLSCLSPIVIIPKKVKPGEQPQKYLSIDY